MLQVNYGQTGGKKKMDLNVVKAWKKGFTGKGVVVVVLDDGIEHTHPDLVDNYVSIGSSHVPQVIKLYC